MPTPQLDSSNSEPEFDPIEKLAIAREFSTKEANRFQIVGVVLVIIYLAKVDGVGLDQIVFGKKLGDLHVGAFVYLIAGQLSCALAHMRYSDASTYESELAERLGTKFGISGNISKVFPNPREWIASTMRSVEVSRSKSHKFFFWIAAAPTLLLALTVFLLPALCGLYYVGNPLDLKFSVEPNIELTLVVLCTIVNLSWLLQGASHVVALEGDEAGDATCVSGRGSRQKSG